jgi:excisionase family DNA binding protein
MEKILLTPEEAAQALNISRTKVFELLQLQALKSVKIGKSRRIPTEAVREYVACLGAE